MLSGFIRLPPDGPLLRIPPWEGSQGSSMGGGHGGGNGAACGGENKQPEDSAEELAGAGGDAAGRSQANQQQNQKQQQRPTAGKSGASSVRGKPSGSAATATAAEEGTRRFVPLLSQGAPSSFARGGTTLQAARLRDIPVLDLHCGDTVRGWCEGGPGERGNE